MEISITDTDWDAWISEEDLLSLNDEDVTWFKEELGLSKEDLSLIIVRANEFDRELKPQPGDELEMTYDTDGAWYIYCTRVYPDTNSRWKFRIYRKDQTIIEQQDAAP